MPTRSIVGSAIILDEFTIFSLLVHSFNSYICNQSFLIVRTASCSSLFFLLLDSTFCFPQTSPSSADQKKLFEVAQLSCAHTYALEQRCVLSRMVPTDIGFDQLRHISPQQQRALEELHSEFWLDKPKLLEVMQQFDKELKAGLADDRSSDLNMIPSFVTGKPNHLYLLLQLRS